MLGFPEEMLMSVVTDERFSKGNVAQTLRKILYPELAQHQVEAIVVR
jgi:hypothetical protein